MSDDVFPKYLVLKSDGRDCDPNACYFVLRLDTDKAARAAALAYADACDNQSLANDLRGCVEDIEAPPSDCGCRSSGHERGCVATRSRVWRHGGGNPVASLRAEVERLRGWVSDLQSGAYLNCVYCGHRYGPNRDAPASTEDALREHVERCPEHPMSRAREENAALRAEVERLRDAEGCAQGILDVVFVVDHLCKCQVCDGLREDYRKTVPLCDRDLPTAGDGEPK